ncbi:hypothetical protein RJ639_016505 [Escallonia herrerae]|uniref:MATH domain-containing protein n=1 Tax=Escallonia herrerae TaxID=1293975 RepID=A0AA89AK10_9ASTE|nr:hypothetical protein RJ639_016505 [Escallonia herrerae]
MALKSCISKSLRGCPRKLSLYPNGNTNRGGKGHLSLYLEIAGTGTLPPGWEVHVNMKMLVYDHKKDKFFAFQDDTGGTKRFHPMKTEWGLDKLLPLCTFNDTNNNFLVDDSCVFGVELFLVRDTGDGESMSFVKDFKQATHIWTIDNLSGKRNGKNLHEQFSVGGPGGDYTWCICLSLNGAADAFLAGRKFMSVSLHFEGAYPGVPEGGKVYAEYKLRIKHHLRKGDYVIEDRRWFYRHFHCRGCSENLYASIDYPTLAEGFLFNDVLVVEAEIMNIGLVKGLN